MRLITTKLYPAEIMQNVTMNNCRIYLINDDDNYFNYIIENYRMYLDGSVLGVNEVYIVMNNVHITDALPPYAMFSFIRHQRQDETIFELSLIAKEEFVTSDLFERYGTIVI